MKFSGCLLLILSGVSVFGQTNKDSLAVKDSCEFYIPNILTVNCQTGEDYIFQVISDCDMQEFQIKIYNRWGELLYESFNSKETWDAHEQEQGTYVYMFCGTSVSGQDFDFRGHITLIK